MHRWQHAFTALRGEGEAALQGGGAGAAQVPQASSFRSFPAVLSRPFSTRFSWTLTWPPPLPLPFRGLCRFGNPSLPGRQRFSWHVVSRSKLGVRRLRPDKDGDAGGSP